MIDCGREPERPSADALLAQLQQNECGRLKIFLGAAPGVGKTYAMLEAAQARREEGVDVAVGVIETHGRAETEILLAGLETVPRRLVEYRGLALPEMDLDALLVRHPRLALVDELAHTNAPGSRHPKRYQDVEELLEAGIDVYTTVNIQHLESLNDAVAQITGVRVRETIPDGLLERAHEVELVDLSPEALLQRLQEGKVYVPDQAERAIHNYFRAGNLMALRELALRRTAERVDTQMQGYMRAHAIRGPWPAGELIMVCVSESPLSQQLVRMARRMSDRRRARWLAVYVETPHHHRLNDAQRACVEQTLRLAEQLGGEVATIPGISVADDLVRYARSRNVTELLVGKSLRSRWDELRRGSVVHDIIRKSGDIDVYVVTGEEGRASKPRPPALWRKSGLAPRRFLYSTLSVAVATAVAAILQSSVTLLDLSVIFLPTVLISAMRWGLGASILASVLSVLAYDFLFVVPLYTLTISDPGDVLALGIFLVVAVLTSDLAARQRSQAEAALRREERTAALYALSRQMTRAADLAGVLQTVVQQVAQVLAVQVIVLLPEGERLALRASQPPLETLPENELAAATWAWQHNHAAGRDTDTLAGVGWRYQPMTTAQGAVGVLGLKLGPVAGGLGAEQLRLLEALAGQAAIGIERALLAQDVARSRLLAETDRLRNALFSSISHDLRTPLASILGSASSLLSYGDGYDEATRRDLLLTIREEAERLNRFVGNLLDMTRLEAGGLQLRRDWLEIGEVIGAALARLRGPLAQHPLSVSIAAGIPLLWLDFVLREQVFFNVLDNAIKYSQEGAPIQVRACVAGNMAQVEIADTGIGVPAQDLERIFDKFYRVQREDHHRAGAGLGLSICRGIVEAHGGSIDARPGAEGRGTVIRVHLPIQQPPALEETEEESATQESEAGHD